MKKGILFFIIFALIISTLIYSLQSVQFTTDPSGEKVIQTTRNDVSVDLNKFLELYKQNKFQKIELRDNTKLQGYELINDQEKMSSMMLRQNIKQIEYDIYTTNKPADTSLNELGLLLTGGTTIDVKYTEKSMWGSLFFEQILPLLFLVIIIFVVFKFFMPKGGAGFPFGAQAGKLKSKEELKTTFADVAGMEEVKEELKEIVDYLKNPKKYIKLGARIPRGVLLYGPPGSGKTLMARAVAGEANVSFFAASGSEFMEMLVGMGAAKVRELFNKAKAAAPSIVFIDEIDTIGKKRGGGYTGGHQEQEQTLNQILTEMDGFDKESKVIVMAATNRPDILDPALLRSGRFDRKTYVGRPTLEERLAILKIHTADKKLSKDIDLEAIARRTSGFVGADLANIANEAALKVARDNRNEITNEDMDFALEKTVMGPEKKIKSIKEKERKIIAHHELGHAVTAYLLPNADPVEKISIVSRGMALGVTWIMPQEDTYLSSKAKFLDEVVTFLGGRAAEELFFGKDEITTGASNDFEKATRVVSDMVLKYGMDEQLGPMVYYDRDKSDFMTFKPWSEKTAEVIDAKIKSIVTDCYNKAIKLIKENKPVIEKLAVILLDKEYLTKEEFVSIMQDPSKADELIKSAKTKKTEPAQNTSKNKINKAKSLKTKVKK